MITALRGKLKISWESIMRLGNRNIGNGSLLHPELRPVIYVFKIISYFSLLKYNM